ncbi:MAG: thrombospondin type 3 repeat-containing protein [Bdellovibrionota bacterium]
MNKSSTYIVSGMIFAMILVMAEMVFSQSLWSFTLTLSRSNDQIGFDGTNGVDSQGKTDSVYQFNFNIPSLASVGKIEIDFGEFGTGSTFGFNLENVELADVSVTGIKNFLNANVTVTGVTVDNANKTLLIDLSSAAVSGNAVLIVKDLQNPPCPVTHNVTVELQTSLGASIEDEQASIGFSGASNDTDGDRLPDGFEIYYAGNGVRGEEDTNAKTLGLDPDATNSFTAENDGDGFHLLREFLGCTDPHQISSTPLALDSDGDKIYDVDESFPGITLDTDGDGTPDRLDTDSDGDGVADSVEAGKSTLAPDPVDTDGDLIPDFQDTDSDDDFVPDSTDNCRLVKNILQANADGDSLGDDCDNDNDNDGIADASDNCPLVPNPSQADDDGDGFGNECQGDTDGDGEVNGRDNCPTISNPDQLDTDLDGLGDACDSDIDGDALVNPLDNCPLVKNFNQLDSNSNGIGDACDTEGFVLGGSRLACQGGDPSGFYLWLVLMMIFAWGAKVFSTQRP